MCVPALVDPAGDARLGRAKTLVGSRGSSGARRGRTARRRLPALGRRRRRPWSTRSRSFSPAGAAGRSLRPRARHGPVHRHRAIPPPRAGELGDRRWADRPTLPPDPPGQLELIRGREIDLAGDGVLAAFDGPARAMRCARAIRDTTRVLGLELGRGSTPASASDGAQRKRPGAVQHRRPRRRKPRRIRARWWMLLTVRKTSSPGRACASETAARTP